MFGDILICFREYALLVERFAPPAKQLAKIFQIDELDSPRVWAVMMYGSPEDVHSQLMNLHFVVKQAPKILNLVKQDSVTEIQSDETGGITIILFEEAHKLSTAKRITDTIDAVGCLYEVCADVAGERAEELSMSACDSGSDKSFDFLGAAKAMASLKELILSLWDRVIFFREKQMSQRLDLIANSLPIMEKISELEESKKVGPEQAEIMRRKVLEGASKFLSSGATIPEIYDRTNFDPKTLMAPEPKLLTARATIEEDTEKAQQLTSEERKLLEKLQQKAGEDGQVKDKDSDPEPNP